MFMFSELFLAFFSNFDIELDVLFKWNANQKPIRHFKRCVLSTATKHFIQCEWLQNKNPKVEKIKITSKKEAKFHSSTSCIDYIRQNAYVSYCIYMLETERRSNGENQSIWDLPRFTSRFSIRLRANSVLLKRVEHYSYNVYNKCFLGPKHELSL